LPSVQLNRVGIVHWLLIATIAITSWGVLSEQPAFAQAADARVDSAPATPTTDGKPPTATSFWDIVFSGGIVGFLIVLLLFALSLTAAALVVEHVMTIRQSVLMPAGLGDSVRKLLLAGQVREADALCTSQPSFLSYVLQAGISELEGGWSAVEKALEDTVAEHAARLFRKIEYLSVIGNIAPMVGLLGTVTGMIIAFQQVAVSQGASQAGQLAEGIYQALITTVGGLIVAIPSLAAFAIFRNRVDQFVAEAAYTAQHVFSPLKRRRTTKKTTATPPPAS
jgi:biopolymer transport protein ExbB